MELKYLHGKIKRLIFGKNDHLPLERRIQILLTFLTAIIIFLGFVFNILYKMNGWFTLLTAIGSIVVTLFFLFARNSNNYQRSIFPLFLVSVFLLSIGWFLNAGYDGTMSNLIFVYFLASYAIIKPKYRSLVFLSFLAMSSALIVIQYSYPALVIPHDNNEQRFLDLLSANILYFFLFYFFIDIIVKNYANENKEIASINEELRNKNKEIVENNLRIEESEEKYRVITQSTVDVIFMLDQSGKLLFINDSLGKYFGYTPEELVGKSFTEIVPTEEVPKYILQLKNIFLHKEVTNFITQIYNKDRNLIDVEINGKLIKRNGEHVGLGTIREISERKRAEEALKESETKFHELYLLQRLMSDTMPDLIWAKDLHNKYIFANKAMCEKLLNATDTSEPIGKNDLFFALRERNSHPEDPQWHTFGEMCRDSDTVTLKEMKEMQFDEYGNVKGKFLFLDVRKAPLFNSEGKLIGVVGSARDVTEQREAEEALSNERTLLRTIIDLIPDAIYAKDLEGRKILANPTEVHLTGKKSEQEVVGKTDFDLYPKEQAEVFFKHDQSIFQSGIPLFDIEGIVKDNAGKIYSLLGSKVPLKDAHGKIIGIVGLSHDITERKSAEEARFISEKRLKNVIENSPDTIYTIDLTTGKANTLNRINFYGYTKQELESNESILHTIYPNDLTLVMDNWKEMIAGKSTKPIEYRILKKDGDIVWIGQRISVMIRNEDNTPNQILVTLSDINDRKRIEESLRTSEERQRFILESMPVAIYTSPVDSELDTAWISGDVKKITGFEIDEYLSENDFWRKRLHPDDKERILNAYRKISLSGELILEYRWQCKDGQYYWFQDRSVIRENESRKEYLGVIIDITKSKLLENEIHEKEIRYRNIIENLHEAYYEADSRAIFTYCNPALIAISGYTEQELIGSSSLRIVAEEHRVNATAAYSQWKKEKRTKTSLEFLAQKKNGDKFWVVQTTQYEFDEQGHFIKGTNIVKDIHERKLTEEALRESEIFFRSVWEHSASGMRLTDEYGTVITVNQAFCTMVGKTEKEMVGSSFSIIYSEKERSSIIQKHQEHFSNRTVPQFVERELLLWNGKTVWFEVSNSFVEFGESKTLLLDIFTDITEQKNSEQIIRDVQRRESIGVLAGGIAHDFNNLLTSMMGNVSLAKSRVPVDHPSVQNLDRAMMAAERAATLTKQMLAYSGKGRFQIIPIDLVKIVQEFLNLFEASHPKNIAFVTHPSSTPVFIKGDPEQIEQIVMNVIINAGEAIGEKQGIVDIGVSIVTISGEELISYGRLNDQILKNGEYALFQVSDNGIGMNDETIAKIFDPFFTTKFVGRGLGLSAVLGIIRGHNGGITVNSKEGEGTIVQVVLPLLTANVGSTQKKNRTMKNKFQSPSVLVIDDEQYVIDLIDEILEVEHYQRYLATDPVKGVKIFKEHWKTIDVVILDYSMPKMNGKEVLNELRTTDPKVKVILSSGYSEEELNHLMGDVKPSAVIQKPNTPDALMSIINKVLNAS